MCNSFLVCHYAPSDLLEKYWMFRRPACFEDNPPIHNVPHSHYQNANRDCGSSAASHGTSPNSKLQL